MSSAPNHNPDPKVSVHSEAGIALLICAAVGVTWGLYESSSLVDSSPAANLSRSREIWLSSTAAVGSLLASRLLLMLLHFNRTGNWKLNVVWRPSRPARFSAIAAIALVSAMGSLNEWRTPMGLNIEFEGASSAWTYIGLRSTQILTFVLIYFLGVGLISKHLPLSWLYSSHFASAASNSERAPNRDGNNESR